MLIPEAPVTAAIDPTVQVWVTGIMAVLAAGALIGALWHWRMTARPTMLLLFLAGGAMMVIEPLVDLVGGCWHPAVNAWHVFTAYGRPMPLWLCLCYFYYFGVGVSLTWVLLRRGLTGVQIWGLFVAGMVGDLILEVVLLHFDVYIYYGWQPLLLLKFPLWWAPSNSLINMLAAALVCRYESTLTGWKQLLIIPIALSSSAAVSASVGWPSWLVINSDVGWLATQLGGLATFALSFWFMSLISAAVARPEQSGDQTLPLSGSLLGR